MDKILGTKISRESLGQILGLTTLFAVGGAVFLDRLGMRSHGISPVAYVLIMMLAISILFVVWPGLMLYFESLLRNAKSPAGSRSFLFRTRGIEASKKRLSQPFDGKQEGRGLKGSLEYDRRRQNLSSDKDPRLNAAIFAANVPTFILDADQRFIDWNPAFHLAFRHVKGLRRGSHVALWFKALDNFKRVPKRFSELYGDAILPMADRERVSYDSDEWGRMVFVKIMTPILDRKYGRIIGWTVVLNINSVGRRIEFFEALYAKVSLDTRRRFYAACYDSIFNQDSTRRDLIAAHTSNLGSAKQVLDVGAFTGELTCRLAREGRMVTSVEEDVHLLRRIADKTAGFGARVRLVKQSLTSLRKLPAHRYDGVTLLLTVNRWTDPVSQLKKIRAAMRDGGTLTMSAIIAPYGLETIFNSVRHEMAERGRFEALKDQFHHVLEHERQEAMALPYHYPSLQNLRTYAQDAGFTVEKEILLRLKPEDTEAIVLLVLKS